MTSRPAVLTVGRRAQRSLLQVLKSTGRVLFEQVFIDPEGRLAHALDRKKLGRPPPRAQREGVPRRGIEIERLRYAVGQGLRVVRGTSQPVR